MPSIEAIIYAEPGTDPAVDRIVSSAGDHTTIFVAVPDHAVPDEVARGLVDGGVQAIEVCGGMGPLPAAKVIEAVGDRVPVGLVNFGVESVTSAAEFKARAERGDALVGAFIYLQDGADPQRDRVVSEPGSMRTLFVPVPDESSAPVVAAELVDSDGVELIELYRGIGPVTTAKVIEAVGARVPVGSVLYERARSALAGGDLELVSDRQV